MIQVRLTPAAFSDMASIWSYTAEAWGVEQADSYTRSLQNDMARLHDFPDLGTPFPARSGHFRKLPSGHHLIFYQTDGHEIEIVRVLHERMDFEGRL